ncbi:MAG: 3-deoxy-manno-octulosonate cytidylyltransferase [Marinagarivorans sp.]|nr:3-deoxy-manno-octulosonate cytidylyltransferase [Marinagarivorans sp.]
MSFVVVVPARYASTRLPGKPLIDLAGKPMIEHVYRAAQKSGAVQVVVATDDDRIADAVKAFGGEVCMTRSDHESGTDRLQEVAAFYAWPDDQIVVNVQGDEPLIPPEVIDQVANNLANNPSASASTLAWPVLDAEQMFDPNAVKVVADSTGLALYFSRAPIPWHRDTFATAEPDITTAGAMRHIGIYGYKVGLLHQFVTWPMATLESIEKLEQLRILANGQRIHVTAACVPVPAGVDTPADAERVKALLENSL